MALNIVPDMSGVQPQYEGNLFSAPGESLPVDQMSSMAGHLQKLAQSTEYAELNPQQRARLVEKVRTTSDADRAELLTKLTYSDPMVDRMDRERGGVSIKDVAKGGAATAIDMVGQGSGAILGGVLGTPGAVVGESLGAYGANQANKALGLREGKPFAWPPETSDVVAAGTPLGFRVAAGGAKIFTKPGQQALLGADTENTANELAYAGKRQGILNENLQNMGAARDKAASTNAANAEKYQAAVAKEDARFKDAVDKITSNTNLTNQQRAQDYMDARQAHQDALQAHKVAYATIPAQGKAGVNPVDYKGAYAASSEAAGKAGLMDVTPLNETATELGVNMSLPISPLDKSPMARIVNALKTAGVAKEPTESQGTIIDPTTNRPATTAVPGTPPGVSVESMIASHQELGKVVGSQATKGGKDWGVAKKLYAQMSDLLEAQAAQDPQSKKAIEQHLVGQKGWRQEQALKEWDQLFQPGHNGNKLLGDDTVELNAQGIRNAYHKLINEDRFFAGSFEPGVTDEMKAALKSLPGKIPTAPTPKSPITADYSGVRPKATIPQPATVEPDYSKVVSRLPGQPPEPVQPDVGRYPFSRFILTKIGVAEGSAALQGQAGANPGLGLGIAAVVSFAPNWVSKTLLKSEAGQQIIRNVISGKQTLRPADLAALTSAARLLGGKPEEGE